MSNNKLLMSSLIKSHNWSFPPRIDVRDKLRQGSGKTNEKTGFPLKNCGNDIFFVIPRLDRGIQNINHLLLLMVSLVQQFIMKGSSENPHLSVRCLREKDDTQGQ